MNEIENIISEVKHTLAAKQKEMKAIGDGIIAYTAESFRNREMEVFAFEVDARKLGGQSAIAAEMVTKCKNDAQELMIAIDKIKVL
ncbi:hypothetical protein [Mucilaginibacter paludis]|nr:hypothetical protein [Mucilaginibacter paludis]